MSNRLRSFIEKRRRTPLLSDWIPIEDYVSDRVLLLTDGSVYACFEVQGRPAETADASDIMRWHSDLNQMLRNLCVDRLVLSVKLTRGFADPASWPAPETDVPFVGGMQFEYRENLLDRALYENRIFLTLEYRPARPAGEWVGDRMARMERANEAPTEGEGVQERLDNLERCCELVESQLAEYGPTRLGRVERNRVEFDQMLEAEAFIATGVWRQIGVPSGRPGSVLLCEDVTFHHEHIEIRGPGYTTYAAHLGFKDYPANTYPGILGRLLDANFRYSMVQTFRFMEQSEGQDVITRKQNKMLWGRDRAVKQIGLLDEAANDLQDGKFVMGDHGMTLCVFADRPGAGSSFHSRIMTRLEDGLRRAGLPTMALATLQGAIEDVIGSPLRNPLSDVVNAAWKSLATTGCVVARESRGLMGAWLSMLPGNSRHRVRVGAISSRNFAGFNPLHGFSKGAERSRWGAPIAITVSPGGTPHRYHWHDGMGDGAVGNTYIDGEIGSGKTTGAAFFIANTVAAVRNEEGGWIGLDHKRGWNALTLAMGGRYSILGDGEPALAPMKALEDGPRTREFLTDLFRALIRQGGWRDLTPEEDHRLALGIETVMQNPAQDRWIREVQAMLGDHPDGAGSRLRKWCWGEELGWVLDAPKDLVDMSSNINCFDTTRLLANMRARGPAMLYLFFRIEQRLNGKPLLITVDEGWFVAAEEEVNRPALEKIARTIRSKNGVLVFLTQSPRDAVKAGMAAWLVEQFPNGMHFANPRITREDFVDGLRRTNGEFDALMTLKKGTGSFLSIKAGHSSIQTIPLRGMDDAIAILSASEANLEAIDTMSEADRKDPVRFQSEFHRLRREIAKRNARTQAMEDAE